MIGSGVNRITLRSGVSIRGSLSGPLVQNSIPSFPVRSSRSIPYHDARGAILVSKVPRGGHGCLPFPRLNSIRLDTFGTKMAACDGAERSISTMLQENRD